MALVWHQETPAWESHVSMDPAAYRALLRAEDDRLTALVRDLRDQLLTAEARLEWVASARRGLHRLDQAAAALAKLEAGEEPDSVVPGYDE